MDRSEVTCLGQTVTAMCVRCSVTYYKLPGGRFIPLHFIINYAASHSLESIAVSSDIHKLICMHCLKQQQ